MTLAQRLYLVWRTGSSSCTWPLSPLSSWIGADLDWLLARWAWVRNLWFRIGIWQPSAWLPPRRWPASSVRLPRGKTGSACWPEARALRRLVHPALAAPDSLYDASAWVFQAAYVAFFLAVALSLWRVPPRRSGAK